MLMKMGSRFKSFKTLLTKETILLSVVQVNNVFGVDQPIEEISEILKDYRRLTPDG